MARIDDVFLELFQAAQEYVSEADHLELCTKMLNVLSSQGDDDLVDEALEEVLEEYEDYDEEETYE